MTYASKLRSYIDQAIITRNYAALAVLENRLAMPEDSCGDLAVEHRAHEVASFKTGLSPDDLRRYRLALACLLRQIPQDQTECVETCSLVRYTD